MQSFYTISYITVGPDSVPWRINLIYTTYFLLEMLTTVQISLASLALKLRFERLNNVLR